MKNLFTLIAALFVTTSLFGQARKPLLWLCRQINIVFHADTRWNLITWGPKSHYQTIKQPYKRYGPKLVISKMRNYERQGFPLKILNS